MNIPDSGTNEYTGKIWIKSKTHVNIIIFWEKKEKTDMYCILDSYFTL
jgi:hypothetical protein